MNIETKKFIEEDVIKTGREEISRFGCRHTNGFIEETLSEYEKEYGKINWHKTTCKK